MNGPDCTKRESSFVETPAQRLEDAPMHAPGLLTRESSLEEASRNGRRTLP